MIKIWSNKTLQLHPTELTKRSTQLEIIRIQKQIEKIFTTFPHNDNGNDNGNDKGNDKGNDNENF